MAFAAVLHEQSPLYGASELYVERRGAVVLLYTQPGEGSRWQTSRYERMDPALAAELLDALCAGDPIGGPPAPGPFPPAEPAAPVLLIGGGASPPVEVPFRRAAPTPVYEEAWLAWSAATRSLRTGAADSTAGWDAEVVPDAFAWAAERLRALRVPEMAPIADPEALEAAAAAASARDAAQREAIEADRAARSAAGLP